MIDEVKIESPAAPPGTEKVRVRKKVRVRRESGPGEHEGFFHVLPPWVWWVALGLAAWGLFSVNPLLTAYNILVLPVLASLLWSRGEPPVLLFACGMQWLMASTAVFYTDFYGLSLKGMHGGTEMVQAIWLSSLCVLVLGLGMRLALVRRKSDVVRQAEQESRRLDPARIFVWYLIAFVVFYFVNKVASMIPPLRQPLQATGTLRWVMVFLVAYAVLNQRRHYALLGIVVGIEFFTGILGFFSGFKSVFFILLIVLSTARHLFHGWKLVQFFALAVVVLFLCVVWTVIKPEYREFLNQGSGQQEVVVSVPERLDKINELVGGLNRSTMEEGLENLILRVSYVQYFALCIMNVPANLPHERGALWLGAIKHVFMPRFLFPDKPVINDSVRTQYYTGLRTSGAEEGEGTSICIGYMGESYIDFGPVGMFAPILLLGMFYGFIYRYFVDGSHVKVIGFGLAVAILAFGVDGGSNIKIVGGNVTVFVVMALFAKLFQDWLWRLISVPDGDRVVRRRRTGRNQIAES